MNRLFMRSFAFPALVAALFVALAVGLALASLARNLAQIDPLRAHLAAMQRVQAQSLAMQYALVRGLRADSLFDRTALAELRHEVRSLTADPALLSAAARRHLGDAHALLAAAGDAPQVVLAGALTLMHEALAEEGRAHDAMLASVSRQARFEMRIIAGALALILLAGGIGFVLVRRRMIDPLRELDALMARLARHDFVRIEARRADSLIAPLLDRYNDMVARLAELEAAQAAHRATLEQAVQQASRALAAHSRSLAEADKLAAVGELAASVAHELRNPLAGVQLAVANLRHDLPDADSRARLDAVIGELERMGGLLNVLLDQARHAPEATAPVALARACDELFALARYQIAPEIVLSHAIDAALVCVLPPDRLRQALLNLILNAAQVLPGRGAIRVSAASADGMLALSVEDDGPGFPEAMLRQGVTRYVSQRPGGTGLGLATVRRFAHDLGGALALENVQPHGARVWLRLPCAQPG